ncbi:MAG: hypothetical protein K1X55_10510, partial [Chitinophagales bacterium]|nr:hypothetical protein [Chitinophagales bacterium]
MNITLFFLLLLGIAPSQLSWQNFKSDPDFNSYETVNAVCTFSFENLSWNAYLHKAYFRINYEFKEQDSWVKNPDEESIEEQRVVVKLYEAYTYKLRKEISSINLPQSEIDNTVTEKFNSISNECSTLVQDYKTQLLFSEAPTNVMTQYG